MAALAEAAGRVATHAHLGASPVIVLGTVSDEKQTHQARVSISG